ncbi:MAG: ATP-binding protein, partial [Defluviitaleaceae bacterium]|nr:ATP-binding protein [Defluviitaleaceae bacterium]
MTIEIKNIGKLSHAHVELNGITIIAGENNSGKSTVGKVLFALITGLSDVTEQIEIEKGINIIDAIKRAYRKSGYLLSILPRAIIIPSQEELENKGQLVSVLNAYFARGAEYIEPEIINATAIDIQEVLSVPNHVIFQKTVMNKLRVEFNGQLTNMHFPKASSKIQFRQGDINIEMTIEDNMLISELNPVDFHNKAIYVDNPYVLDRKWVSLASRAEQTSPQQHFDRQLHLFRCLDDAMLFGLNSSSALGDILKERKLKRVFEVINAACPGEIKKNDSGRFYSYIENDTGMTYEMDNVSTGLKSFAIIKALLQNDCLQTGNILILDEPEIHLHPEWQIVLAELLILIQKELSIRVLINTHSPYFLNAIEIFSKKHGINDKCKFYQSKNE